MKTAIEWLAFEINRRGPKEDNPPQWLKELYEQAKEMEKQHIVDAHLKGQREDIDFINEAKQEAEQYYNETFKSE